MSSAQTEIGPSTPSAAFTLPPRIVLLPSEEKSLQSSNHLSGLLSLQLTARRRPQSFNPHISPSVAVRAFPEKPNPIPREPRSTAVGCNDTSRSHTLSHVPLPRVDYTRAQIVSSYRTIDCSPYTCDIARPRPQQRRHPAGLLMLASPRAAGQWRREAACGLL